MTRASRAMARASHATTHATPPPSLNGLAAQVWSQASTSDVPSAARIKAGAHDGDGSDGCDGVGPVSGALTAPQVQAGPAQVAPVVAPFVAPVVAPFVAPFADSDDAGSPARRGEEVLGVLGTSSVVEEATEQVAEVGIAESQARRDELVLHALRPVGTSTVGKGAEEEEQVKPSLVQDTPPPPPSSAPTPPTTRTVGGTSSIEEEAPESALGMEEQTAIEQTAIAMPSDADVPSLAKECPVAPASTEVATEVVAASSKAFDGGSGLRQHAMMGDAREKEEKLYEVESAECSQPHLPGSEAPGSSGAAMGVTDGGPAKALEEVGVILVEVISLEERRRRLVEKMGLQGAASSGGGGAGKVAASTGRTGGGAGGMTAEPGDKIAAPGAETLAVGAGDAGGGPMQDKGQNGQSAGNELDSVFKRIVSPAGSFSQREGLRAGNGADDSCLDSASNVRPDATIRSLIQEQKQLELQSAFLLEQARIQKLKSKGFSGVDLWAFQ